MAVFGKINDLSSLFSKTEELNYLSTQIESLFREDFLSKIRSLAVGENFQTPLDFEMFFVSHCYALKDRKEGFFESHHKYIDIQIVIEGFERFLIGDHESFKLISNYDESKDLEIHSPIRPLSEVFLREREMCVLFDHDIHGVGIGEGEEQGRIVRKVIFKIPKTLIKHRL